jgi:hypothetical protein
MTIPASNFSIDMIRDEFSAGSGSISLSQLYRGGSLVPNVTPHNSIPTSGSISFSNFASVTAEKGALFNYDAFSEVGVGAATSGIRYNTNGSVDERIQSAYSGIGNWISATRTGAGSDYQIRATKTGGTNPSGSALATWLDLSSAQEWRLTSGTTSGSFFTCTLTIEIRIKVDAATYAGMSCTVTITASRL